MTLQAEVMTDPLNRGYSGMTDLQVANDLNTVNRTKTRATVSGAEIFNATNDVEYAVLTEAQKASWDRLCAIDSIDTASGVAKAREAELFGSGSVTRSNLAALKNPAASRAEELGIPFVYEGHVQEVRR